MEMCWEEIVAYLWVRLSASLLSFLRLHLGFVDKCSTMSVMCGTQIRVG